MLLPEMIWRFFRWFLVGKWLHWLIAVLAKGPDRCFNVDNGRSPPVTMRTFPTLSGSRSDNVGTDESDYSH